MMTKAAEKKFANRVSSILRWALGLLFIWMAYQYEDAEVLYFFGGAIFISGFFKTKRCTEDGCEI